MVWCDSITKYTIYCKPGLMLSPGEHFLLIGDWLHGLKDYVVLVHGVMTNEEVASLHNRDRLVLFYDKNAGIISIRNYHGNICYADDRSGRYKVVGVLERRKEKLYSGSIKVFI